MFASQIWASPIWLSVRVALIATVLAVVLGIPIALWLARKNTWIRRIVEAVVAAPIVIPPTVLGYYLLTNLGRRSAFGRTWERIFGGPLVFTVTAAVVAATVSSLPFFVRGARAAIADVNKLTVEAARVLGLRRFALASSITLPLARRGLAAATGLAFARALGDFGVTLMVAGDIPGRTRTAPIAIYSDVQ